MVNGYEELMGSNTDLSDHTEQTSPLFKYGYPDSPPIVKVYSLDEATTKQKIKVKTK